MASLTIDYPSQAETQLAEKRDFYVWGSFSSDITTPGDMRIDLYAGASATGSPVRTVTSRVDPSTGITPDSSFATNYTYGSSKGTGLTRVPDLLSDRGGLYDPNNKLLVNQTSYVGEILGGTSQNFDTTYSWPDGTRYQDLTAGTYTVQVTGLTGGVAGLTASKQITLGTTYLALGRFSPTQIKLNLMAYAAANGEIVRLDPLPGMYWVGSGGYEIPNRWMINNAVEVVNDTPGTRVDTIAAAQNDLVVYSVSPANATQYVEVAALTRYGLTTSAKTTFLYYNLGEPALTYTDPVLGQISLTGQYTAFPGTETLEMTRAEVRAAGQAGQENLYINQNRVMTVEDPGQGLVAAQGQCLSLYGVAKPIPSAVTPTANIDGFTVDDRIASIRYDIADAYGKFVYSGTKSVALNRIQDPSNPSSVQSSIYEFKHDFTLNLTPGTYQMEAVGIDVFGLETPGSLKRMTLMITQA